jgi:hypothetical protein
MLFDLAITPNPLVDQNGNYILLEVRLNQSEFEYFTRTTYYDACAQIDATSGSGPAFENMPVSGTSGLPDWAQQGAVEIKASWRILDPARDITRRYFTTRARISSQTARSPSRSRWGSSASMSCGTRRAARARGRGRRSSTWTT